VVSSRSGEARAATRAVRFMTTLLTGLLLVLVPAPALALGDWDPEDEGPLDFRWLGATYVSDRDQIQIVLGFYEDFRPSAALYRFSEGVWTGVRVRLTSLGVTGRFFRRADGRIKFLYGDFASGCGADRTTCYRTMATVTSSSMRFTIDVLDEEGLDHTYEIRGTSRFDGGGRRITDWTGVLDLGSP